MYGLWVDDSVLRGDGEVVSGPRQVKAQLSGGVVPNLGLTGRGCTS